MTLPEQGLLIRPAAPADSPLIAALIVESFAEYDDVLDPPSGAHRETEQSIAEKLESGGAFLAALGQWAVGCVLYQPDAEYMYLGRLAVLPAYQGYGIGHRLVRAVENRAHELGLSRIQIGVRVSLPQNRAYFERLGFRFVRHESPEGYTEPTYITMAKTLHLRT